MEIEKVKEKEIGMKIVSNPFWNGVLKAIAISTILGCFSMMVLAFTNKYDIIDHSRRLSLLEKNNIEIKEHGTKLIELHEQCMMLELVNASNNEDIDEVKQLIKEFMEISKERFDKIEKVIIYQNSKNGLEDYFRHDDKLNDKIDTIRDYNNIKFLLGFTNIKYK